MNPKDAVLLYQFGERSKSELIVSSQLLMTLPDYREAEHTGAKRMLIAMMDSFRSELNFAFNSTHDGEFKRAIDRLGEAISLTESNDYDAASVKISESISAATTAAQKGWQVLNEHGFL